MNIHEAALPGPSSFHPLNRPIKRGWYLHLQMGKARSRDIKGSGQSPSGRVSTKSQDHIFWIPKPAVFLLSSTAWWLRLTPPLPDGIKTPLCLQTSVCSSENCSAMPHLLCLLEKPPGGMVLMEALVGGWQGAATAPVVPSATLWCIQPWSGVHSGPGGRGGESWQRTGHSQNRLLPSVF